MHRLLFMFIVPMLGILSLSAQANDRKTIGSKSFEEVGGRQWVLRMEANDRELTASLKRLPLVSWCFEGVQGRGLLKNLNFHLVWNNGVPELSWSRLEISPSQEDASILLCLDATLKENPPQHSLQADEINFQYTVKRRR